MERECYQDSNDGIMIRILLIITYLLDIFKQPHDKAIIDLLQVRRAQLLSSTHLIQQFQHKPVQLWRVCAFQLTLLFFPVSMWLPPSVILDDFHKSHKASFSNHEFECAFILTTTVQQQTGDYMEIPLLVLLQQTVDHLQAHIVYVRSEELRFEETGGALSEGMRRQGGGQVCIEEGSGKVDVGSQRIVYELMFGATACIDNIIELCSKSMSIVVLGSPWRVRLSMVGFVQTYHPRIVAHCPVHRTRRSLPLSFLECLGESEQIDIVILLSKQHDRRVVFAGKVFLGEDVTIPALEYRSFFSSRNA